MNVSNLAFYIGKSSNNNVVIYSYNINNGLLDTNNPLSSYWIMRENDNKIEDLTFLEKSRAFGHEIIENPLNNDDIPFKIVSVDDIMNIRKDPENPSKYNVIIVLDTGTGVNEYILKKIYLHLSGALYQNVDQIDYIYENPETHKLHTFVKKIN